MFSLAISSCNNVFGGCHCVNLNDSDRLFIATFASSERQVIALIFFCSLRWLRWRGVRGVRFACKWSAAGKELIGNGHYMYYSPYWGMQPAGFANGRQQFRPVQLVSMGLVNDPNIPVPAMANENQNQEKSQLLREQNRNVGVKSYERFLVYLEGREG